MRTRPATFTNWPSKIQRAFSATHFPSSLSERLMSSSQEESPRFHRFSQRRFSTRRAGDSTGFTLRRTEYVLQRAEILLLKQKKRACTPYTFNWMEFPM